MLHTSSRPNSFDDSKDFTDSKHFDQVFGDFNSINHSNQVSTMERNTPLTISERIELDTMRELRLHTSLEDNLHKCNPQDESPLYTVLPKEIRDLIFAFATSQTEDLSNAYKPTDYWYRPGSTAPLITYTALLRTCRRVYLETHNLPLKNLEVKFYFADDRGPPQDQQKIANSLQRHEASARVVEHIDTVHFHTQMFIAERMFWERGDADSILEILRPRCLRLTIRHTDWWDWEDDLPLEFQMEWLQRLLDAPWLAFLETFTLELETLESKKDQLKPIVDELLTKVSVPRREPFSEPEGSTPLCELRIASPVKIQNWTGPADIAERSYTPYKDLTTLSYHISILTWTSNVISSSPEPIPSSVLAPAPAITNHSRDHRQPWQRCGDRPRKGGLSKVREQLEACHRGSQMPYEAFFVQWKAARKAESEHESRRLLWSTSMAKYEAQRLRAEWRTKNSLLDFTEDEPSESDEADLRF
jgi:hypothetical protein